MAKKTNIVKNVNSLPLTQPIGQPLKAITANSYINTCRKTDLKAPNFFGICDLMYEDDAIRQCTDISANPVIYALANGKFEGGKSKKSKKVAAAINYAIRNLTHGSWREFCENLVTDQMYGFSINNTVSRIISEGEYKGIAGFAKFSPRSPHNLKGWIFDTNMVEVIGCILKPMNKQDASSISRLSPTNITSSTYYDGDHPILWHKQMVLSSYNKTFNNPEGNSPYISAYASWKEKQLIRQYEIVGVSKDFGGVALLRVDEELLVRAAIDEPAYDNDRATLEGLKQGAARIHSGESTLLVLSSQLLEGSTSQYKNSFELKGIDGQGKQYKSTELITQRDKAIYNVFGASHAILGQDGSGSFALSSTVETIQDAYTRRAIEAKVDVIENQILKIFIEMNANNPMFKLAWDEIPKFVPAEYKELDLDTYSKIIQRVKSVQGMPEEHHKEFAKKAGLSQEWEEKLDYKDKGDSRAGEGLGDSGVGNTQAGGISSTTNAENGGVAKALYIADNYKDQLVVADEFGNQYFLDKPKGMK